MIVKIVITTMAVLLVIIIIMFIQFVKYFKVHAQEDIAEHRKYILSRMIIMLAMSTTVGLIGIEIQILKIFQDI
jgi:hypothetical protein